MIPTLVHRTSSASCPKSNATQSPLVYALPPEVIARIFLLAKHTLDLELEEGEDVEGNDIADKSNSSCTPVQSQLSHICSYFRQVALGTPTLWTSIVIKSNRNPECIQAYCARSSNSPLDIRIVLDAHWFQNIHVADSVVASLNFVLQHTTRWRRLSIISARESTSHFPVVRRLCGPPAPKLEHLSLDVHSIDGVDVNPAQSTPPEPTIFTQSAPNLTTLRLRGLAIPLFRPALHEIKVLYLEQTTHIPMTYSAFRELLMTPRNLSHLSVYGDILAVGDWPTHTNTERIHLPALESLRICSNVGQIFAGMLMNMHAPLLESLALKEMQEDDLHQLCFGSHRRCFPQVKNLTFCDFDISEINYRRLFDLFPSIASFSCPASTLVTSRLPLLLYGAQYYSSGLPSPWPDLQALIFGFDHQDEHVWLEDLIHQRKELGYPLSELKFATREKEQFKEWTAGLQDVDLTLVLMDDTQAKWPSWSVCPYVDPEDTFFF